MGLILNSLKILTLTPLLIFSQTVTNTDSTLEVTNTITEEDNSGIIALPFTSYSPETAWSFGVGGMYYFLTQPAAFPDSRTSNFLVVAQYTTKKQMIGEMSYDLYFYNNNYRLYGNLSYAKFPFSFFGIGNNTEKVNEEIYTPRYINLENTFIKKIYSNFQGGLSAGVRLDFRNDEIINVELNGILSSENIKGKNGGIVSGLGFTLNWDTRDNTFCTTSGEYLDFKANFYGRYFFGDFNFNRFIFDGRKFFSVGVLDTVHVFAMQFVTNITSGDVPFYLLPTFGGNDAMRGIFQGRFRDKVSVFFQSEYRFPVFWRFAAAVFGGAGQVASSAANFSLNDFKIAYGAGIRFTLIPEQKISVRIDFGFSYNESQFYLGINEAF
jgi:hypothetical protein